MRERLVKALPLVLAFLGIASLHVIGFGSHSDSKLIQVFDSTTATYIGTQFTLHVLLATLFARFTYLFVFGPIFLIVARIFGGLRTIRNCLRHVGVWARRSQAFEAIATVAFAVVIFSRSYLQINWISLITVWVVITLGIGSYLLSKDAQLIAGRRLRGKQPFLRAVTDQEQTRTRWILRQIILQPSQGLLLIYLALATAAYAFGAMREESLRTSTDGWVRENYRFILPVSDGSIVWDVRSNSYAVLVNGQVEWELPLREVDQE